MVFFMYPGFALLFENSVINMGFHSVCCEYNLLTFANKEIASAYGRAEYNKVGKPNNNIKRV